MIHQSTVKLTDFGNSCLQGSKYTETCGVIPYVDPKILESSQSYISNAKSDIYSLGVIFWELTSCSSPFNFKARHIDITLALEIVNGKREKPISGTNSKFVDLYQGIKLLLFCNMIVFLLQSKFKLLFFRMLAI